ncbi:hypothetical protein [Leifsonia sp. WHRI 6310E]|uniref:hypothetical protein n=1 Tax=Leifsonia sp. WHRI 6310E TaxID=3162562 RepID=UPI0032EB5878
MSVRKSTIFGGVLAALLCLGAQAAPALAQAPDSAALADASGTTVATAASPISAAAQATHEASVSKYLASHPKPSALSATASPESLQANRAEWFAYLQAAPWTDIFGQWGCTVSNLNVVWSAAGDGNSYPTLQDVVNCGSIEGLTGVAGSLETRSAVLAQPDNAELRASLSASSAKPDSVVTPLAVKNHCSNQSSTYLCIIWDTSNGLIGASAQWQGSSATYGHVRLGNTTGQACGLGTFVANGPDGTLNPGSVNQALVYGVYQNGNWSSRFYNPNFYSGYCANNV